MYWSLFLLVYLLVYRISNKKRWDYLSWRVLFFFVFYWIFSIGLSEMGIFGLSKVSNSTYLMLTGGIVSFMFGYSLIKITPNRTESINEKNIIPQIAAMTSNVLFLIIMAVLTIYIATLYASFIQRIILLSSMTEARGEAYSGNLYGYFFDLMNSLLLSPLNMFLLPVWALLLILKKRNVFFWISTFFITIYASLRGGRIEYIQIIVIIFFVYYCLFDRIKQKRNFIFYSVLAGAFVFAVLCYTSALRNGQFGFSKQTWEVGSEIALKQIQTYSAGPISAFDYGVNDNYVDKIGGYQYGRITLTSLDRLVCLFLRRIGLPAHDAMEAFAEIKQNLWIDIGEIRFNALYTAFMPFYLDFGIYGVIIIPFILGIVVRSSIRWMYRNFNIYSIILVSILFYTMFRSVMDWNFYNSMDVVLLIFLYYKGKQRRNLLTN